MSTPTTRLTWGAAYATVVTLAALALSATTISTDELLLPLGCALAVGLLLTVRQAPGHPGAALVLLPAIVADDRLGTAVLPALAVAAVVSNMVRGVRGDTVLIAASHTMLA